MAVKLVMHRLVDPLCDGGQPLMEAERHTGLVWAYPRPRALTPRPRPGLYRLYTCTLPLGMYSAGAPPTMLPLPRPGLRAAGHRTLTDAGGGDSDGLHPTIRGLHLDVDVLRDVHQGLIDGLGVAEHAPQLGLVDHLHLDCVPVLVLTQDRDHLTNQKPRMNHCFMCCDWFSRQTEGMTHNKVIADPFT